MAGSSAGASSSKKMAGSSAGASSSTGMAAQRHVLLVDHGLFHLMFNWFIFRKFDCKVSYVESGSKALEFLGLVDDNPTSGNVNIPKVNMVCTAYNLEPEMNGYQLLQRIKQSSTLRDLPVVFVSSTAEPTRVNQCMEAGAVMFIEKPLKSSHVEELMKLME